MAAPKTCPDRSGGGMDMPCAGEKCARWVRFQLGSPPIVFELECCGMIADREQLIREDHQVKEEK